MKAILNSRIAVVRALAAGYIILCAETGEGWQLEGGASLNRARHLVRWIFNDFNGRKTFYIYQYNGD